MIDELNTVVNRCPQQQNVGQGVNRFKISFTGKEYSVYQRKIFAMKQISHKEKLESVKTSVITPKPILNIIFTQMNAECGVRKHGE